MYRVYADGVLIHDDNAYNRVTNRLISPSLSLKDNSSGAFTATIPVGNVCYDSIRCFDTTIDVFRHNQNGSDTWIWSGRPLKISKDFYNQKKLTAEGVLSFLNDIVVPLGKLYRLDLPQYVRFLLDIYNMHVASNRRITAGGVSTISSTGKGTGFHDYEFDGDNVLSYLSKALEDWGLHARIRRTGNSYSSPGYVLDLVTDSQLPMSRQTVNFGKNLLDYTSDDDWSELVTAILPYGATIEEESSEGGEESGVEYDENDSAQQSQQQEEDDAPKPKYTIFGLQPSNPKFYADGAYLVNRVMENIHGRIEQTVEWSDIKDPVELLALAEAYLNDYTYMTQKLTVKVIDLHYLTGSNEIAFDFLSQINCFSSIHGLNDTFIVKEMTIPFDNPENTSFTMNRETRGYYGADRKSGGGYSSKISATSWHIPAREGILRVARENAEALINMMTNGYVTLVPTEDGDHVWALTVTNGIDEASSTQMWKWTLGGLMFQERSSVSAEWGLPNLALTMDGQIVATRITTGTLAIDDGQGGYLILANMDTGTLQIGSFDVTGTSIYNTKRYLDDDNTKGIYIGFDGIAIGELNSGLFKVDVYNDIALIAGFNFNGYSIYKDKTSLDDDSVAGVYISTDGVSIGDENNGLFKVNTSNNTAFIAGFNFDDCSFYTNDRASLEGSGNGVYLGTDGISTGDANGLYTVLANGYLTGGSSSESGYVAFNTINTTNNQNGIRVAGKGCVAILTDGAFGVGAYSDVDGAANIYEGATTSISIPSISGGYKYYTYKLDVTWKDYTISGTSFKVPTEIKLTPTEATGTFDGITSYTYEFKYGLLNTKSGSGEGGSGSGSGSGSGGSGSGSGEGGSGEGGSGSGSGSGEGGSGSGTHIGTVDNVEYVFFDTINPPSEWTQRERTYAGIGVPKAYVTAAQNFVAEHSEYKLWIAVSETGSPLGHTNPYFTICLTTTEPTFGTDLGENPSYKWTAVRTGFWQGVGETTTSNGKSYLIKNITFNTGSGDYIGVVDAARPVYSYYWGDLNGSGSSSGSGASNLTDTITLEHASTPSSSQYHMYGTDGQLKDSDAPATATIKLSDALLNAVKNTLSHGYDVIIKVDPTNNTSSTGTNYYSIWSIESGKYEIRNDDNGLNKAVYNTSGATLPYNALTNGNKAISRSNATYSNGALTFDVSSDQLNLTSQSKASGEKLFSICSDGGYFKIIEADDNSSGSGSGSGDTSQYGEQLITTSASLNAYCSKFDRSVTRVCLSLADSMMSNANSYRCWCYVISYDSSGDTFAIGQIMSNSPFTVSEWINVGTDNLNIKITPTDGTAISYLGGRSSISMKEIHEGGIMQIGDKSSPVFGMVNWYQMSASGMNGATNTVLGYLTNTE